MQLFACSTLVRLASRFPLSFSGECESFAPLVSSAISLGEQLEKPGTAFLAWRFLAYPGECEDAAFLALAILLLAVPAGSNRESGEWLNQLAQWVEDEEFRARVVLSVDQSSHIYSDSETNPHFERWLFGLTLFKQNEALWCALASQILMNPKVAHPFEADESLRRIGRRLTTGNL